MELLKQDLRISLKAVKVFQEGGGLYQWHDGRIRYLLELLYGNKTGPEMPKERRTPIQESKIP